jgi:RNA polymerase sigma-70 factor (ECF subfamily)
MEDRFSNQYMVEEPLADAEVVARVQAGEPALFEILMRRYNQRLFRVARAILSSDIDAEDAVQQSYLSAYAHLAQFNGAAQFSTWLTRIAIHEAIGRVRKRTRLAEVDIEEQQPMKSTARTPEEQAATREEASLLEEAVEQLPDPYRVVFMMREVQEMSVAETAACLDLSEENVKVRLHRAKAMLREAVFSRMENAAKEAFPFLGARCDRIVAAVMSVILNQRSPA